jgi:hypothetical protein
MEKQKDKPDAGLRSLDHCTRPNTSIVDIADHVPDKVRLPKWRYHFREQLLPIVRWETPYVAWLQDTLRSGALDTYFAYTANLGTHTFFMVMLPILFWCGGTSLGRAYA